MKLNTFDLPRVINGVGDPKIIIKGFAFYINKL